jgi:transcriptional regulator with XRE-family HTH domain
VPAKKPESPRVISPDMRAVGRAIKAARVEAGLTQEKLAERSEIAPRVLQKIEAGRITILVTTLIRIRRALGCDFDDLLPR